MLRFPCHQQDGVHNSGLQHNLYNDGQLDGWWGGGVIKRFFLYTTACQVPIFEWRFDSAGVSFRAADLSRSVIKGKK